MNFERFKNIKPDPTYLKSQLTQQDKTYLETKIIRKKSRVVPIILETAAVFVILAAVIVWALIGSGIRGKDPTVPKTDMQTVIPQSIGEVDKGLLYDATVLGYTDCMLHSINVGSGITIDEIRVFAMAVSESDILYGKEFNEITSRFFGIEFEMADDMPIPSEVEGANPRTQLKLLDYSTEQSDNGVIVSAEFEEFDLSSVYASETNKKAVTELIKEGYSEEDAVKFLVTNAHDYTVDPTGRFMKVVYLSHDGYAIDRYLSVMMGYYEEGQVVYYSPTPMETDSLSTYNAIHDYITNRGDIETYQIYNLKGTAALTQQIPAIIYMKPKKESISALCDEFNSEPIKTDDAFDGYIGTWVTFSFDNSKDNPVCTSMTVS